MDYFAVYVVKLITKDAKIMVRQQKIILTGRSSRACRFILVRQVQMKIGRLIIE